MTDRKLLPDTARAVRYASPLHVKRTDSKEEIKASAFFLPRKSSVSTVGLSVNRLENADTSKDEQLAKTREFMRRNGLTLKKNGRFAELCVGDTMNAISRAVHIHNHDVKFICTPLPENPLHCDIVGLPLPESPYEDFVADLIRESVIDIHPAILADSQ